MTSPQNSAYNRWHSCERKIRYKSRAKAENGVKSLRKRGIIMATAPKIYECELCGGFHMAHDRTGER